jgi:tRNA pseudouridine55 synthase
VLASDLGERMGVGAHLESLRRVRSGSFDLSQAIALADLTPERGRGALIPMDAVALPLPDFMIEGDDVAAFAHGRRIDGIPGGAVRVAIRDSSRRLLGLARLEGSEIIPEIVLGNA